MYSHQSLIRDHLCLQYLTGISHNKILSKIASAMNKPNNQTVVPVHAVARVMCSLPLRSIRNFGGAVGHKLEALGCSTAADVQALPLSTLEHEFRSSAEYGFMVMWSVYYASAARAASSLHATWDRQWRQQREVRAVQVGSTGCQRHK